MPETAENTQLGTYEYLKELGKNVDDDKREIRIYTDIKEELNSLFNGVGLRYLSNKYVYELKGKDTQDFLNRIATNSLKDLKKGQLKRTFFTTAKGRIIDLTTVVNFEDYSLLLCNRENKEKIFSWISRYIIADDVEINDTKNKHSLIELIGPQVNSFITLLTGNGISEMENNQLKVINTEGLMFFVLKLLELNGEIKYWLISDQDTGKKIIEYIIENKGPYDFNLIGEDAYNLYRIEKGFPLAPNELNDNYNPHDLGLLDFVDFKKGCYIGQEVIARLDTYQKVQKKMKNISINSRVDIDLPYSLIDKDGNKLGEITSICYCESSDKSFGLAFIKKAYDDLNKIIINLDENREIQINIHNSPIKK